MKPTPEGSLLTGIFLKTFKLHGQLVSESDLLVKELGLTSARWKILGALVHTITPMTVPDIARAMGQSRQAIQRISTEMIAAGLLVTQTNPSHQRAKYLALTDSGKHAYEMAMQKQTPWVNSLAKDIDEEDLELVNSVLEKLTRQFDA